MQKIWQPVKRVLHRIGQFQSAVILSVLFLVFWVPVGLLTRLCADWLRFRRPPGSNWWPRSARFNDPAALKDPF